MALLILGLLLLSPRGEAAPARPEDPYQEMARKIAFAAREKNFQTMTVVPFSSLDPADDLGGKLVAERLASRISGITLLDARPLESAGPRLPSTSPKDLWLDVDLFERVFRQFQIQDMELADNPYERDQREKIREALKRRQFDTAKAANEARRWMEGEAQGADAVAVGILIPLADGTVEVHVRLVDTDKKIVLATVSSRVSKDWGKPPFAPPRDYSGLAALVGTASVGLWFVIRAANG